MGDKTENIVIPEGEVKEAAAASAQESPEIDPKVQGTVETPSGDAATTPDKISTTDDKDDKNLDGPEPIKPDFFSLRLEAPSVDTGMMMELYGKDGFGGFKERDEYWKDENVQNMFVQMYGEDAKGEFDNRYDAAKTEFSAFKLGVYKSSVSMYDEERENTDYLNAGLNFKFDTATKQYQIGDRWTDAERDVREASEKYVTINRMQPDGTMKSEQLEYTPELKEELEQDPSFSGFAYPEEMYATGPHEAVNGLSLHAIYDNQIYDIAQKKFVDVQNHQVVSNWDIETGSVWDGILDNNKLEADGVLDYVKIAVKAPINMAVNMLDTTIQLARASMAFGYSASNFFREEDSKTSVREDEVYKWLTARGIKAKGYNTSMSREAMNDGFFGSLEVALSTVADVALQVGVARGLGAAGSSLRGLLGSEGLSAAALAESKQAWAGMAVRSTLTALAIKDSYNEALETGFSESEASIITGAMALAMWKATAKAEYLYENFEVKASRKAIASAMSNNLKKEQEKAGLKMAASKAVKVAGKKAGEKEVKEKFAMRMISSAEKAVSKVFNKAGKVSEEATKSAWWNSAQQEALEEMTEELFQDGVKHVASAYGKLINDAVGVGKGRYATVFDEGYFKEAIERYATSGIAGGFGGPIGLAMSGGPGANTTITSNSSLHEIVAAGKTEELIDVLKIMKENGEIGPLDLSTEFNEALGVFEPIVGGEDQTSLGDMIFDQYMHDINIANTLLHSGQFGDAVTRFNTDAEFKKSIEGIRMSKDFTSLTGRIMDLHQATGISLEVFEDFDAMTEAKFKEELPAHAKKMSEKIDGLKKAREENQKILDDLKEGPKKEDPAEKEERELEKEAKEEEGTRLDREIQSLNNVKDAEVEELMDSYRRVRAMANGTASEYYFMQNILNDDKVFGSRKNRDAEFLELGDAPFIDHMMAVRNRTSLQEKEHALKVRKATEIDEQVEGLDVASDDILEQISGLLGTSANALSKKSVGTLLKALKNIDYSEITNTFDPYATASIFTAGIDQTLPPEIQVEAAAENKKKMFLELAKMNPKNKTFFKWLNGADGNFEQQLAEEFISNPANIDSYFEKVAKDPESATLPHLDANLPGDDPIMEPGGVDFIEGNIPFIETVGRTTISNTFKIPTNILSARKSFKVLTNIKTNETFFDPSDFKANDPMLFFNKSGMTQHGLALSNMPLDGFIASEVNDVLNEVMGGEIFTKTDTTNIDEGLKQIKFKRSLSGIFESFSHSQTALPMHTMLLKFRKNVINLLEDEYDPSDINKDSDTFEEDHAYKDYSAFTDIFTDYIYDPVKIDGLINQDMSLDTEEDVAIRKDLERVSAMFKLQAVDLEGNPVNVEMYADGNGLEIIKSVLDAKYEQLGTVQGIEGALKALQQDTFNMGDHEILLDGVTRLDLMEWLLNGVRVHVVNAAGATTPTAFIQEKQKSIKKTFSTFNSFVASMEGGKYKEKEMLEDLAPTYATFVDEGMKFETKEDHIVAAKANIEMEKALHGIYNGAIDTAKYGIDKDQFLKEMEVYLYNSRNIDKITVLAGALTTDFTPFYEKFKGKLEVLAGKADFDMVIASQEDAAKYAAASVYSNDFVTMTSRIVKKIAKGVTVSGTLIQGVAGSGKTTAVTQLGMSIASEILQDRGESFEILPVSNNTHQIENLEGSVGKLKGEHSGLNVDELLVLLEKAVKDKDKKAIESLASLGTVLIDEVTYIPFSTVIAEKGKKDPYADHRVLNKIDDYISTYNSAHRAGKNNLSLVMMGDSAQSGATAKIEGSVKDLAITSNRTISLGYMDYSFRGRNSYLVDSIKAITKATTMGGYVQGTGFADSVVDDGVVIAPGMKYGITNDTFHGVNVVEATDGTSKEFNKMVNDSELVANIKRKMDEALATEDSKEFSVMVSPEKLTTFTGSDSLLLTIYNEKGENGNYKYRGMFKLISADKIGGSEANYVIAEMPLMEGNTPQSSDILKAKFNTLATRGFDFVSIANKSPMLKLNKNAAPKRIDGNAIIPDKKVEGKVKKELLDMQLAILSDITSSMPKGSTEEGTVTEPEVKDDVEERKDGFDETVQEEEVISEDTVIDETLTDNDDEGGIDEEQAELPSIIIPLIPDDFFNIDDPKEVTNAYANVLFSIHAMFTNDMDSEEYANTMEDIQKNLDYIEKYGNDKISADIQGKISALVPMSKVTNEAFREYMANFMAVEYSKFVGDITLVDQTLENGKIKTTKLLDFPIGMEGKNIVELTSLLVEAIKKTGSIKALEKFIDRGFKAWDLSPYLYSIGNRDKDATTIENIIDGKYSNDLLTDEHLTMLKQHIIDNISVLKNTKKKKKEIKKGVALPDIEAGSPVISSFKYLSWGASIKSLADTIKSIKAGDKQLTLPAGLAKVFSDAKQAYNRESIVKSMLTGIEQVYKEKKGYNDLDDSIKSISEIGSQLGLNTTLPPAQLAAELEVFKNKAIASAELNEESSAYKDIYMAEKMLSIMKSVHSTSLGNSGGSGYYYYNRGKEDYSLEDYIENAKEKDPNKLYTMGPRQNDHQYFYQKHLANKGYTWLSEEDRGKFLIRGVNSDPDKANISDCNRLEVIAKKGFAGQKSKGEHVDILIAAVDDETGNKYIIAKVDTSISGGKDTATSAQSAAFTKGVLSQMQELGENEVKIIEVVGEPSKLLNMRAGEVLKGGRMPITDLITSTGINATEQVYVMTDEKSKSKGGLYIAYSFNPTVDMDAELISTGFKDTGKLPKNTFVTSSSGDIPGNIGVIPVDLDIPFKSLVDNHKSGIKFGNVISIMSLTMQKQFASKILRLKDGDMMPDGTTTVTPAHLAAAQQLQDEFDASFEGRSPEDVISIQGKITAAETMISSDPALNSALESLAGVQINTMTRADSLSATELNNASILSLKMKTEFIKKGEDISEEEAVVDMGVGRALNINMLIEKLGKGRSPKTVEALDKLAQITGFSVGPMLEGAGKRNSVVGVLGKDFLAAYKDFITVSLNGIRPPEIELTGAITSQVIDGDVVVPDIITPTSPEALAKVTTADKVVKAFERSKISKVFNRDLFNRITLNEQLSDITSFLEEFKVYLATSENMSTKTSMETAKKLISDRLNVLNKLKLKSTNTEISYEKLVANSDIYYKEDMENADDQGSSNDFVDALIASGERELEPAITEHILLRYAEAPVGMRESALDGGAYADKLIEFIFIGNEDVDQKEFVEGIIKGCIV